MPQQTSYTREVGDAICESIAEGESLRAICRKPDMPTASTVLRWALRAENSSAEFVEQYARAREMQAEMFGDELREIVDDGSNDWMEEFDKKTGASAGWKLNGEAVLRSRLRFDQRRWWMSKVLPKKYGEKLIQEHTGEVGIKRIMVPERIATEPSKRNVEPDFS